jgi:hypothetical protein
VSKIEKYANFTNKNAVVSKIPINFKFFPNNFVNSPKKGQKNGQKLKIALENYFAIL